MVYALDIGGSSVKSCLVHVKGDQVAILERYGSARLPSRQFSDVEQIVVQAVGQVLSATPTLSAVGISTTGSVDSSGIVVSAGHFQGYVNVSWNKLLRRDFPRLERVVAVNDGRASTWAEYCANISKISSHIHAVVGTGVGGGIVYKGDLMQGDSGQAGYIGHIKITLDQTALCSCGKMGCVETLASGPAIVRHFNADPSGPNDDYATAFDTVCELARKGDMTARAAFSRAGYFLGMGLGNAMNVLNPSQVTVGGGVILASESIDTLGDGGPYLRSVADGIQAAAHKRVAAAATLRQSVHGNDGGMVGAALLAAQ